jgi:hypothetical protein
MTQTQTQTQNTNTLRVKAASALVRVPMLDLSGYIENVAVDVPDHAYYRRAIKDGDLALVEDTKPQVDGSKPASKSEKTKE